MSPPAQKAGPLPVINTARTLESSAQAISDSSSPSARSWLTALYACGRFNVITAHSSVISRSMAFSDGAGSVKVHLLKIPFKASHTEGHILRTLDCVGNGRLIVSGDKKE